MKLPKDHRGVLTFKHKDVWYKIIKRKDKYELYKLLDVESLPQEHWWKITPKEVELLATGNSPKKLEEKVYDGKL